MEIVTVTLIILIAIMTAAIVFLAIKLWSGFDPEVRKAFLDRCLAAIKIVFAALEDGKITSDELKKILKALVEIITVFKGSSYEETVEELGAAKYLDDNNNVDIKVEN